MQATKTTNLLTLVPQPQVKWERVEEKRVVLLMPRYGAGRIGRWVEGKFHPRPVRIRLDEIGSAAWLLVDGRRTVDEIGRVLQKQFGVYVEPIYDRLAVFFKHLDRQNLIAMASH